MKFVIKSLLFVNLILQMTSSLRKCFDQDQNLMLIIILIAFSLIGLIGLIVGNRFILIIFAACTTLILIASITIYAIGNTEQDHMQPKVPYYTNGLANSNQPTSSETGSFKRKEPNKLKSLVGRVFGRVPTRSRARQSKNSTGLEGSKANSRLAVHRGQIHGNRLSGFPGSLIEDTDDPSIESRPEQAVPSGAASRLAGVDDKPRGSELNRPEQSQVPVLDDQQQQEQANDLNQVPSEQWIAYEQLLYQRYLNIVSQSVDLILQTILASWMALLLDDDSDRCFGSKPSGRNQARPQQDLRRAKEDPVYNYNGVRYSIRPDNANESPSNVVVR